MPTNLFMLLAIAIICSCSSNSEPNTTPQKTQGTSDGGGGIITGSTKEEVRTAIYETRQWLALLINEEAYIAVLPKKNLHEFSDKESKNLLELAMKAIHRTDYDGTPSSFKKIKALQDWMMELQFKISDLAMAKLNNSKEQEKLLKIEIEQMLEKKQDNSNQAKAKELASTKKFSRFIMGINLNILQEGPCKSKDKDHADASVSKNSLNATVCFSLAKLTRIPKASLNEHIAGLWMHELSHMAGLNENDSQKVEKLTISVYKNFYRIILGYSYHTNRASIAKDNLFFAVKKYAKTIREYLDENKLVRGRVDPSDPEHTMWLLNITLKANKHMNDIYDYNRSFIEHFKSMISKLKSDKNTEAILLAEQALIPLERILDLINLYTNQTLGSWSEEHLARLNKYLETFDETITEFNKLMNRKINDN